MADLELEKLGRYAIVRELGRGAMGIVYEGHDPIVGRRVALKTARRDVIESSARADELMERFLREARAAGALSHPNILTIYDAGEENGMAYIAMEFLDGTDLQKLLEQNRKFPVERVLEITSTICGALAHAHEHGVIHRDIKPANVVVLENGLIKVADFGIARITDSHLTQEGTVIGTPHYMSPEQFMGHAVDARSDLFSAGVIVYEMLTGEKPFHGNSLSAVMHSVLNVIPVPPRQLNFAVCECLSRVVMKALCKDMRARYQSADEMCRALKECLKEQPDPAVLQVDTPDTAAGMSETIRSDGPADTLVAASADASTRILDAPDTNTIAPEAATPRIESAKDAGLIIRQRRLERGKTLEAIYTESHVPERYLIALEDGDLTPFEDEEWSRVADSVRALCNALDLEPTPYLDVFEVAYTEALRPSRRRLPRRAFLVGGGSLAALALVGWAAFVLVTYLTLPEAEFLAPGDSASSNYFYYQAYKLEFNVMEKDASEKPADEVMAEFSAVKPDGTKVRVSKTLTDKGRLLVYDRYLRDLKLSTHKVGYNDSDTDPSLRKPEEVELRNSEVPVITLTPLVAAK